MERINNLKQVSPRDFGNSIGRVMSCSADVTQRTFGGFVALLDFTRKVTLMFGFTAYVERTAASEMQTWPRFFKMRRQRLRALSRHAERPRSYASLKY